MAYEYQLARDIRIVNADVLDEPDVNGVVEVRMEVQQDVDAGLGDCANMPEYVRRFGVRQLRRKVDIQPLQAVSDGPAEQGHVVGS